MKIGIMQPYFIPYLGYWQLINAVDLYVVYDDVNFVKRGWVNRNRILVDGKPRYFNVPLKGASQNKRICEIGVDNDARLIEKNLRTIEFAYKKAPYYQEIYALMERILTCGKENLAEYLMESIKRINSYLGITTELVMSSSLKKDCSLKGQDKILSICGILGATEYYNAIGGTKLYSYSDFKDRGISLKFLKTGENTYRQFGDGFQENLSIIDMLMFNSKEEVREALENYLVIGSEEEMGKMLEKW